jgi:hypothetical protein
VIAAATCEQTDPGPILVKLMNKGPAVSPVADGVIGEHPTKPSVRQVHPQHQSEVTGSAFVDSLASIIWSDFANEATARHDPRVFSTVIGTGIRAVELRPF